MTVLHPNRWLGAAALLGAACSGPGVVDPPTGTPTSQPTSAWEIPENEWPVSAPPDDLVGEGFEVGEVIPDIRLIDQHGDAVSTWQFWGEMVLVTISAVWCPPCRDLAVTAPPVCGAHGVRLLTVLEEDGGGGRPAAEDAEWWGGEFGAESPILLDPEQLLSPALKGSYPAVLLLDRELVVVARATELTTETLNDLIESEL